MLDVTSICVSIVVIHWGLYFNAFLKDTYPFPPFPPRYCIGGYKTVLRYGADVDDLRENWLHQDLCCAAIG